MAYGGVWLVERRAVWRASNGHDWHEAIECAVDGEGGSPAAGFLDELASGAWAEAPDHRPPEDEEQIHDHARLLATIEHVGQYGQPPHGNAVRHLREGIWEFKHGTIRLSYWDTPGDGSWEPKPRHESRADRPNPIGDSEGYWWYPDMDECLRLGCAWPKTGQKAPPDKIDEAERLREEDCAHDRR